MQRLRRRLAWTRSVLAKFKAPRVLDQGQQNNISEQVRKFSGTKFDTGLPTGDAECARLMLAIESALTNGGWTQIDWQGGDILTTRPNRPAAGLVAVTNIIIAVYPDQFSQLGEAAKALESVLNGKDIATDVVKNDRVATIFDNNRDSFSGLHVWLLG